jgi:large subunit ribosomal protein L15
MKLNELQPKEGSVKKAMRVGRGIGSGKGKTSGRGQKGQKSRTGVSINGFEGGQMPLYRRLPKRGFTNIFAKKWATLSLTRLQEAIDKKMIDPKKVIDENILVTAKVITKKKDGVRLLGTGELTAKVELKISGGATKAALAAVEKAGGNVEITDVENRVEKEARKAEKSGAVKKDAPAKKKTPTTKADAKKAPTKKAAKKAEAKKTDK